MTGKWGAILIKRFQAFDREIATLRENGIKSRARVSLAHDEAVAIRPIGTLWIVSKRPSVNAGEQIRGRQGTSDVRSVRRARHANAVLPYSFCKLGEVGLLFVCHCASLFNSRLKRRKTARRSCGEQRHRAAALPGPRPRPDDQM